MFQSLWFDEECRRMKRSVGALERRVRRAGRCSDASPVTAERRAQRRLYDTATIVLNVDRKRSASWKARVDAKQSQPHRVWRSFDELLGRGKMSTVDVDAKLPKFVLPPLTPTNRHSLQHPSTVYCVFLHQSLRPTWLLLCACYLTNSVRPTHCRRGC